MRDFFERKRRWGRNGAPGVPGEGSLGDRRQFRPRGGGDGGGGFGGGIGGHPAAIAGATAGGAAASGGSGAYNKAPWLFPTSAINNFDKSAYVAIPAIAAAAVILSFVVPDGYNGKITDLGNEFIANGGAAFVQGVVPATFTWTIQVDKTPLPDYNAGPLSWGPVSTPIPVAGIMIKEGQLVEFIANNVSIVVTTQSTGARLKGYFYLVAEEPEDLYQG
jgi:hypothetical protein